MKKSNQSLNKAIAKKDIMNAFSFFTAFAICGYGIFMFILTLDPQTHSPTGEGFHLGLEANLSITSFLSYEFSAGTPLDAFKIISAIAGTLIGLFQFSFLHRKSYCQGLLSRGIKRGTVFSNRAFPALIAAAIVAIIPKLIALSINAKLFGTSLDLLTCFLSDLLPILAALFLSFSIAVLACLFTGRIIEAAAGATSILLLPLAVALFIVSVFEAFLYGYTYYNEGTFSDMILSIEPFGYFSYILSVDTVIYPAHGEIPSSSVVGLIAACVWIILSIILLLVLKGYFEKSFKAENIGFKGINKIMVFVSSLTLPLFLAASIFTLLPDTLAAFPTQSLNLLSVLVGAVASVLAALGCNLIFNLTVKKLKIGALSGGIILFMTAVFLLLSLTGVFGAYYAPPKATDIKAVKVNAPFEHYLLDEDSNYYASANPYPSEFSLELSSAKDIETIIGMQKDITEKGEGSISASLNVVYLLNNGRKIERSFKFVSEESVPSLLKLWETDAARLFYKKLLFPELEIEQEFNWLECEETPRIVNTPFTIYSFTKTGNIVTITDAEVIKLKNAIYKDISTMSSEEWFNPQKKPLGALSFNLESNYYYGEHSNLKLNVTEDMKNTVEALKELELYDSLKPTIRPVHALLMEFDNLIDWKTPDNKWEKAAHTPYFVSQAIFDIYYYFDVLDGITDEPMPATEIKDMAEIEALMEKGYKAHIIKPNDKVLLVRYSEDAYDAFVIPA